MDRKRLAQWMPWIVGAGFCLIEAMKLAFQIQASDQKNPASGHVEPIRFAPAISADWDYITTPQMIALAVVMVAVMLLAAVMLTSKWWAKDQAEIRPSNRRRASLRSIGLTRQKPSGAGRTSTPHLETSVLPAR